MICYRDTTFCADAERCANKDDCSRWFSPVDQASACIWWGSEDYPVAFAHYGETCTRFKEVIDARVQ